MSKSIILALENWNNVGIGFPKIAGRSGGSQLYPQGPAQCFSASSSLILSTSLAYWTRGKNDPVLILFLIFRIIKRKTN